MSNFTKIPKVNVERILTGKTWTQLSIGDCYTESIFMDSGAYGLFNQKVLKVQTEEVIGKHGRVLERREGGFASATDYSWFDLKPGSDLRKYLATYANIIKKCPPETDTMFVNVDAIKNPVKSYEIHQFFLKEYGVWLVPVVHYGASLKQTEKYLQDKRCDFLGMGGLGHQTNIAAYCKWADMIYKHICPASNKFKPLVRTHGFAMTAYQLICRYPWWSVDSATWVKAAAYGWLILPPWRDGVWRFDLPYFKVNISRKPMDGRKEKFWWWAKRKTAQQTKNRHLDNSPLAIIEMVAAWLKQSGIPIGSFDQHGNITEVGACSSGTILAQANMHYFKLLEESRPVWPYPLDEKIRKAGSNSGRKGFGL